MWWLVTSQIKRVAITGAAGYLGKLLINRLEREDGIEFILATDIKPLEGQFSSKVLFQEHDISQSITSLVSEHGIESIVHLAYVLRPDRNYESARRINVGGTANVLEACADSNVGHLVYLSSTTVYGAHPDNPHELNENAPTEFVNFVSENQQAPKVEMYTDRGSLKRYIRFFGRDKDMSISFSADMVGQDIIYDEHSGTLTIKRIPKSLKQQLKRSKQE